MQLTAGAKLREMESTWVSLVSKNYEIERTIVQLENEISQIKQQHGEANKENIQQDFQWLNPDCLSAACVKNYKPETLEMLCL